jgi:hypothetical protein
MPSHRFPTTHGMHGSRTYQAWGNMISRCYHDSKKSQWYRDRGITVCDRWRHSFESFFADMGEQPAGLTLDRIDGARGYEPGNCRWITQAEQLRNRYNNVWITYDGQRLCLKDACAAAGVTSALVSQKTRVAGICHQEAFDYFVARLRAGLRKKHTRRLEY